MNRKEIKQQRLQLLFEQEQLEGERCDQCAENHATTNMALCCPAAARIREIGDELNALAQKKRYMPEILNREGYLYLKDQDWIDRDIARHYGVTMLDLEAWKDAHGLHRRKNKKKEEEPKVVAKPNTELTVEMYQDLKAQGMSDKKIGERFGMKQSQVQYWRKKNGMASVRDVKQKRMEAIVGGPKMEKESGAVVKVEEKPVVKPEEYEIKRLRTELDERHNKIEQLTQTNGKFAKLYDEEQKRTQELEQQLVVAKAENERIRHLQDERADYKALQEDYETMTRQWGEEREKAEKADEIALEAAEWRRKYENEHLRFLEANAVIMEQKEHLNLVIEEMNGAWDDDIEESKEEARQLREQNAYLKAELQNAKKIQGIHDEFKAKAVQQVQKKNKLIHALMDYYREEA